MVVQSVINRNELAYMVKQFKMYKFRTMKNNSHELREELEELNKNDGLFLKLKMIQEYSRD